MDYGHYKRQTIERGKIFHILHNLEILIYTTIKKLEG